jgi:metallophosphoesterase (TIGR00282 family)
MSKETLNTIMIGDLIGSPGVSQCFLKLPELKKDKHADLVIANGENANEGFGIAESDISSMCQAGVNVITSGNHIWSTKNIEKLLADYSLLLRPANYPQATGKGYWIGTVADTQIAVVNLIGRYQMIPVDCPFKTLHKLLKTELKDCKIIIVDFHAESVSEKKSLAYDFDGKVSLVAGTHTHVQTADEMILPGGTGYITDLGMSGGLDSVIGMHRDDVLQRFMNQNIVPFTPSDDNLKLQGISAVIDLATGKTTAIERISI